MYLPIPIEFISPTKMKVVFVGNLGSEKSTLLNSLLRKAHFASGLLIGTGLTRRKEINYESSTMYVDTPGLDDFMAYNVAAREIYRSVWYLCARWSPAP